MSIPKAEFLEIFIDIVPLSAYTIESRRGGDSMPGKIDADRQRQIFAKNLNYYMERSGKNTADLAADLSFPFSTVSDWVHGKKYPRMDKVQTIADYFGVLKSHLTEEKAPSFPPNITSLPQMREWPVLGATACGKPLHRELLDETVLAPDDIKADVVFRCIGNSMINARIFDGDAVFVRLQPQVENGEIAVVRVGDEYTLKRVYYHGDYVELRPENPTCKAIILRDEQLDPNNFEVVGLAVAFLSMIE